MVSDSRSPVVLFDLDGTLLAGDSFRFFLSQFRSDLSVMFFAFAYGGLRKLRAVSRRRFFAATMRAARRSRHHERAVRQTVAWCHDRWRSEVLAHADQFAHIGDIQRIVVSASPHDYVGQLDELLGGRCYGSTLNGDDCLHLFGEIKRDWLIQHFEPQHYRFLATYFDSASDAPLVELFEMRFKVATGSGAVTQWSA
jgi:phosphoserine phosphatase